MKYVLFVSIDHRSRWSQWHSGPTDEMFFSPFYKTIEETEKFLEQVKADYPDSNLAGNKGGPYDIQHIVLQFDPQKTDKFKTLCQMMRAYHEYPIKDKEKIK